MTQKLLFKISTQKLDEQIIICDAHDLVRADSVSRLLLNAATTQRPLQCLCNWQNFWIIFLRELSKGIEPVSVFSTKAVCNND